VSIEGKCILSSVLYDCSPRSGKGCHFQSRFIRAVIQWVGLKKQLICITEMNCVTVLTKTLFVSFRSLCPFNPTVINGQLCKRNVHRIILLKLTY